MQKTQEMWDWSLGSGKCPGGGKGNQLQCSSCEHPMDRGAWGLESMGSQRAGHNWMTEHILNTKMGNRQQAFKANSICHFGPLKNGQTPKQNIISLLCHGYTMLFYILGLCICCSLCLKCMYSRSPTKEGALFLECICKFNCLYMTATEHSTA